MIAKLGEIHFALLLKWSELVKCTWGLNGIVYVMLKWRGHLNGIGFT